MKNDELIETQKKMIVSLERRNSQLVEENKQLQIQLQDRLEKLESARATAERHIAMSAQLRIELEDCKIALEDAEDALREISIDIVPTL